MSGQYTSECAVAFLDLLGFKQFVKEDQQASLDLLLDIQEIARIAISDAENNPLESYETPELAEIAQSHQIDSFNVFLPISDSVIVLSDQPNLMVRQLSNFLSNCFNTTSHWYAQAKEGKNPSEIVIPTMRPGKAGKVEVDEKPAHWYPKLFRGGLSYGSVTRIPSPAYVGGKQRDYFNVVGIAYVKAVLLEQHEQKGPRLFCDKAFYSELDEKAKRFVIPAGKGDVYEVLWPAFQFSESNDPNIEKHQFAEQYRAVKALSKFYAKGRVAKHYHQYEVLWARSTIQFFSAIEQAEIGWSLVKENFSKRVIRDMSDHPNLWQLCKPCARLHRLVCGK